MERRVELLTPDFHPRFVNIFHATFNIFTSRRVKIPPYGSNPSCTFWRDICTYFSASPFSPQQFGGSHGRTADDYGSAFEESQCTQHCYRASASARSPRESDCCFAHVRIHEAPEHTRIRHPGETADLRLRLTLHYIHPRPVGAPDQRVLCFVPFSPRAKRSSPARQPFSPTFPLRLRFSLVL